MSEQGAEQSPGGPLGVEPVPASAFAPVPPASASATPAVPSPGPSPAVPIAAFVPADAGAAATSAPRVPGSAGERFQRFPTGMMDLPPGTAVAGHDGPAAGAGVWTGPSAGPAARPGGVAGWGLAFSMVGLLASFVVGWAFPVALVGLITGAVALRRPFENRSAAAWALGLGIAGLVYSAGWLTFAAMSADLFS